MPRKTGRPPLDKEDPSTSVHVRIPSKTYDKMYTAAVHDRVSVPEWIRQQLLRNSRVRPDQG